MANEPPESNGNAERLPKKEPAPVLPALPAAEPKLSADLTRLVGAARQPHANVGLRGVFLPEHLRTEARRAADRYEQLTKPPAVERIFNWLIGVNNVLTQGKPRGDVLTRAANYLDVLAEIPEVCFNSGTRQDAQAAFKWFPSAAEVYDLLRPHALALHGKRHALRTLLGAPAAIIEKPAQKPSVEIRDAIVEKFRMQMAAVQAEREAVKAENPRPPGAELKSGHLSPGQLIAAYQELAKHPHLKGVAEERLRVLNAQALQVPIPAQAEYVEPKPEPEPEPEPEPW